MYIFVPKTVGRVENSEPNVALDAAMDAFTQPYNAAGRLHANLLSYVLDLSYDQVYKQSGWKKAVVPWARKVLKEAMVQFPLFDVEYLKQTLTLTWTSNQIDAGRPFRFGDGSITTENLKTILEGDIL